MQLSETLMSTDKSVQEIKGLIAAELAATRFSIEERFSTVHGMLDLYRPELAKLLYSLKPLVNKVSPHEILDRINTLPVLPEERELLVPAFFMLGQPKKITPRRPALSGTHKDGPHRERWVIVADDEEQIRKTFQILLEQEGYKVQLAGNGREALRLFNKEPAKYCIVISDLKMPDKDGIDVLTGIHDIETAAGVQSRVPVVVVTAFSADGQNNANLDLLKKTGLLADYFIKPVKIDDFTERLRKLERISPSSR